MVCMVDIKENAKIRRANILKEFEETGWCMRRFAIERHPEITYARVYQILTKARKEREGLQC